MRGMQDGVERSFVFNDTATTEIYTLSLHDALPIWERRRERAPHVHGRRPGPDRAAAVDHLARGGGLDERPDAHDRRPRGAPPRSEEHTSELQSRQYLVCRLLLEKKKQTLLFPLTRY